MKFVNRFILSLIVLVIALAAISILLPDKYSMQRSITISACDTVVYNYLNCIKNIKQWSPWHILDTNVKYNYYGPISGKGSGVNWVSEKDNLTGAEIRIEESIPLKQIDSYFTFSKQGDFKLKFLIDRIDNTNCKLTIVIIREIGYNLPFRYYALMYDYYLKGDFDTALEKIKNYCINSKIQN